MKDAQLKFFIASGKDIILKLDYRHPAKLAHASNAPAVKIGVTCKCPSTEGVIDIRMRHRASARHLMSIGAARVSIFSDRTQGGGDRTDVFHNNVKTTHHAFAASTMLTANSASPIPVTRCFPEDEIRRRIDRCPKLASLQSVNRALRELVHSEQSLNSQIAEVIRRDPSLSARLLRMVNSVYFGLSTRVNNIEEAVFFLGLRQIRELSMATPVIEELEQLQQNTAPSLPWKDLWSHSIGTAILTREILASTPLQIDDDTDYLIGLLHNVGKIVMAYAFPDELRTLMATPAADAADICRLERELIGWDHGKIGAHYLARHQLSEEIVFAVRYHNEPDHAPRHRLFAAAVQVADHLVRHAGIIGNFEQIEPVAADAWLTLPGWDILYGADTPESMLARASVANSLQRLPSMLQGLL